MLINNKYYLLSWLLLLFITPSIANSTTQSLTNTVKPNQVKLGVYILSIHDINFAANTFAADFWIWANYENSALKPIETMELINAKSHTEMLTLTQNTGTTIWSQKKVQGIFRYHWNMTNFPFDRHKIQIIIEDSLSDTNQLKYVVDTENSKYDKEISIPGFVIKNLTFETTERQYETNYGDPTAQPSSNYSSFRINLELERASILLFIKMHAILYIAFLITVLCFLVLSLIKSTPHVINGIFSALIGSTFATVMNLRSADAIIGYNEVLTLVDRLHILTLIYFVSLSAIAAIVLLTRDKLAPNKLLDFVFLADGVYLLSYILGNIYLVWYAASAL